MIEWYTPIHSDDYRYYLLGISVDSHYHHYMNWSGRIVADYISSLVLYTQSQFIYSLVTSFAVLLFCYFIAKTPCGTLRWTKNDVIHIPLIFFTYWISNPNLGQTTFWIVGSANYLWTNLFVAAWIFYIYKITMGNIKNTNPLIALLSFIAGCSNESVAPFVCLFSVIAIAYELWMTREVSKNKVIYSFFAIVGSCTLIFAPGNFVRASGATEWYGKSLFDRIAFHLTERVHNHLSLIWISYVVLFLLVLSIFFNKELRAKIERKYIISAILMICAGIGTVLIMFASPSFPDRVVNGTFMFFLLAISFIAYNILASGEKKGRIGTLAVTLLCAATFIWSYGLMYKAYKRVTKQESIRQRIIAREISHGNGEFTIPEYFFTTLQNRGGHFGLFHDSVVYGKYYGAKNIRREKISFDYSVLADGKKTKISDGVSAYSNSMGDFIITSKKNIKTPIFIKINNTAYTLKSDAIKAIKINHNYWYYSHIPHGSVSNVSL